MTEGSDRKAGTVPDHAHAIDLMTDRAHSARIYDYLLGGTTNYQPDREAAEAALAAWPSLRGTAVAQRGFMQRTARAIAGAGVTQFLDIGAGIPTQPNLHQVVGEVCPDPRVVYVDNDPVVLAHAADLTSGPGTVAYVRGDAADPHSILAAPPLQATLDLSRPVSVSVIGLLHFLDDDTVARLLSTTMDAVPVGSYLTLTAGTFDHDTTGEMRAMVDAYVRSGIPACGRTLDQIRALVAGWEVLEPGIVAPQAWRPAQNSAWAGQEHAMWAAVVRKP
jgi:hypothetical protein